MGSSRVWGFGQVSLCQCRKTSLSPRTVPALPCGLHADILTSVTTFKTHGFGKHAFREYSFLQAMEFGVGGRMKLSWDGEQQITTVIDRFGHSPRDFLGLNAQ